MMKPVYFPDIYISEDTSEVLKQYFDGVYVYGVTDGGQKITANDSVNEVVEMIHPEFDDEDQFSEFLRTGFNSRPLYDAHRVSALTAELIKRSEEASEEKDDTLAANYRLMRSRVFLQMACEYDIQSGIIQEELRACKEKELELIKELQGFDEVDTAGIGTTVDTGIKYSADFRIANRFQAWIDIYNKSVEDGKKTDPFFITDKRSLVETIMEFEETVETVCTIPAERLEKKALSDLLEQLSVCEWESRKTELQSKFISVNDDENVSLTLFIVPEKDSVTFFSKFSSVGGRGEIPHGRGDRKRNIVIGYIDI